MERSSSSRCLWCVLLRMCVARTSQMMWDDCASSACMCTCMLVCVFISLHVFGCCVSNYGLQKAIMIVLLCSDVHGCSLHREYFVIVVCTCVFVWLWGTVAHPRRLLGTKGSCGMRGHVRHVCGVCVCLSYRWGNGYQLPPRGSHKCTRLALTVPLPLF